MMVIGGEVGENILCQVSQSNFVASDSDDLLRRSKITEINALSYEDFFFFS